MHTLTLGTPLFLGTPDSHLVRELVGSLASSCAALASRFRPHSTDSALHGVHYWNSKVAATALWIVTIVVDPPVIRADWIAHMRTGRAYAQARNLAK